MSIDDKGGVLHAGDLVAQTREAYASVSTVLAEFGATMSDVVDETLFVTDVGAAMANIEALFAARADAYGGDPDVAQTLLQVSGLVMPELEVEIKCVAQV